MRRAELIQGIKQVEAALKDSGLPEVLQAGARVAPNSGTPLEIGAQLIASLRHYLVLSLQFTEAAKTVAETYDLTPLTEPTTWARLLLGGVKEQASSSRRTLQGTYFRVQNALESFPLVSKLLKQESLEAIQASTGARQATGDELALLTVVIPESDSRYSSPERLIKILQSVEAFHEVCAVLAEMPTSRLAVVACDAGSDKSFDFIGAAKVIECIKDLILSLWDNVVYFKEKKMEQRIKLVEQSLPVLERIADMQNDNKLVPEQAETLKRKVITGAGSFLHAGATIPEMEERAHFDPRALMAPQQKLLAAPVPVSDRKRKPRVIAVEKPDDDTGEDGLREYDLPDDEQTPSSDIEAIGLGGLTKDEYSTLMRLLRKSQGQQNTEEVNGDEQPWEEVEEPGV